MLLVTRKCKLLDLAMTGYKMLEDRTMLEKAFINRTLQCKLKMVNHNIFLNYK